MVKCLMQSHHYKITWLGLGMFTNNSQAAITDCSYHHVYSEYEESFNFDSFKAFGNQSCMLLLMFNALYFPSGNFI